MTECAYLKEDLGPILAKGLAAAAIARPQDPVEYLGLWLLHYLQRRERKAQELELAKQLEAEREVWTKGRAVREKAATAVIQREWRAHLRAAQESKQKETGLRQIFAQIEETLEERVPEEQPAEGEKTDAERQAEADRLVAQTAFNRSRVFIAEIDKSYAAELRLINGANKSAVLVLRCCFYLIGMRPRQVDKWEKIRGLIKPYPFSLWLHSFQPCGSPLERKRRIVRARRLLTLVKEDEVRRESTALFTVYQWLNHGVRFREARDEHVRARRAAGREADEELEELEEDGEDEEKDPDEEMVKEAEAEAARVAEAQRLAEAEEGGEGGAEVAEE